MTTFAYSKALALESASDLPYNRETGEYVMHMPFQTTSADSAPTFSIRGLSNTV